MLSCASTSRRCSKGNWRTRFSAAAVYDSKARARHGLRRLLCCHGWCGAMDSHLPRPWGGFSLIKRLLMAAFTRGEEETVMSSITGNRSFSVGTSPTADSKAPLLSLIFPRTAVHCPASFG